MCSMHVSVRWSICCHQTPPKSQICVTCHHLFEWSGKKEKKVVSKYFSALGISDIEELCEREGGFDQQRDPTDIEKKYLDVLSTIAVNCFGDLLSYERLPKVRIIIRNISSKTQGFARCRKNQGERNNITGLYVKYRISEINIREELFRREEYAEALTTYLHELLHQYGNDSEQNFQNALKLMSIRLSEIKEVLDRYERQWQEIGYDKE